MICRSRPRAAALSAALTAALTTAALTVSGLGTAALRGDRAIAGEGPPPSVQPLAQRAQEAQGSSPAAHSTILYVNPATGSDGGTGGASAPLRTATEALRRAGAGTVVQLAPGRYTADSGERFPLVVGDGVTLRGNESNQGADTEIVGGGTFVSRSFARQNAAIYIDGGGRVAGLAVSNPNTRGTGLWIEGGAPVVTTSTFANSHRDGVFVSGNAEPTIEGNAFLQNGGNGLSLARSARGLVRSNLFQATGFGLAIGGSASPRVERNRIVENRDGLVVSDSARPVLRGNAIENNQRDGLVAITNAQPDLGSTSNPGNNVLRGNGRHDIYNATRGNTIFAVGNDLDASRIEGTVDLAASPF